MSGLCRAKVYVGLRLHPRGFMFRAEGLGFRMSRIDWGLIHV